MPTDPTGLTEDTGTVLAVLGFKALCIVAICLTPDVWTTRGWGGVGRDTALGSYWDSTEEMIVLV